MFKKTLLSALQIGCNTGPGWSKWNYASKKPDHNQVIVCKDKVSMLDSSLICLCSPYYSTMLFINKTSYLSNCNTFKQMCK